MGKKKIVGYWGYIPAHIAKKGINFIDKSMDKKQSRYNEINEKLEENQDEINELAQRTDKESIREWNSKYRKDIKEVKKLEKSYTNLDKVRITGEKIIYIPVNQLVAKRVRIEKEISNLEIEKNKILEEQNKIKAQMLVTSGIKEKDELRSELLKSEKKLNKILKKLEKYSSKLSKIMGKISNLQDIIEDEFDMEDHFNSRMREEKQIFSGKFQEKPEENKTNSKIEKKPQSQSKAEGENKKPDEKKANAEGENKKSDEEKAKAEDENKKSDEEKTKVEDENKKSDEEKAKAEGENEKSDEEKTKVEDENKKPEEEKETKSDQERNIVEKFKDFSSNLKDNIVKGTKVIGSSFKKLYNKIARKGNSLLANANTALLESAKKAQQKAKQKANKDDKVSEQDENEVSAASQYRAEIEKFDVETPEKYKNGDEEPVVSVDKSKTDTEEIEIEN